MPIRNRLNRIYGWLRQRITPGLQYSQYLYEARLAELVRPDADWLDVGCGHHVLPTWRGRNEEALVRACRSVTGIDYDMPSLAKHRSVRRRVRGDVVALPFRDESFDLVTANMVVEHLADPASQFREMGRVLRPGGLLVVHTPNLLGYPVIISRMLPERIKPTLVRLLESRAAADLFPTHYRANTEPALRNVSAKAGLDVERVQMVATDAALALIPPLAVLELLAIKLLLTKPFRQYRSNIIATLRKPAGTAPASSKPLRVAV